jgi:lysozyme
MTPSNNCIDLVKRYEGLFLKSYYCPASIVTIGWGSTMYQDGRKIKMGDVITLAQAEELLMWELNNKTIALHGLNLNQNQFDACLSFIYNLGIGAFNKSTLLKKIKVNPDDATIKDEFMKWNKARVNGQLVVLKGLTNRRTAEVALYYKKD